MKIIKTGDLNLITKPIRFTCNKCKCIFEADNNEYKEFTNQLEGRWIVVYCPYCKNRLTFSIKEA